jgi:hypothetical protein
MADQYNILDKPNQKKFNAKTTIAPSSFEVASFPNQSVKIDYVFVLFTSSGAGGNRNIVLQLLDQSSNQIILMNSGLFQTASQSVEYIFMPGIERPAAITLSQILIPIPFAFIIPYGYSLNVGDFSTVSAGDSMTYGIGCQILQDFG